NFFNQSSIILFLDKRLNSCSNNVRKLTGMVTDYQQANQQKEIFITANQNFTEMSWKQQHMEWYGHGNGMTGMTLPAEFTLIKQ
ncbi:MAG: hypothetical protein KDC06_12380, partial [Chitinophagaceae bacterium]|nr:hypothetical protein [Chitinophagaceae bacterium]